MSKPRHRKQTSFMAPTLALILMCILTVILALILKANLPYFQDDPGPLPGTSATPAPDPFAVKARAEVPTLDENLTDAQVNSEARRVCEALVGQDVEDVYYTFESPVATPDDAARFFKLAVAQKCPEHAEELARIAP